MDGSICDGKVGVAAILYRRGRCKGTLRLHLRMASKHTVYKVELVGMILGMQLIKMEKKGKMSC